jgi:hypothetical protein
MKGILSPGIIWHSERDAWSLERIGTDNRMRMAIAASGLGHVARGIEAWAADLALLTGGSSASD